jgi:hypothetical protein
MVEVRAVGRPVQMEGASRSRCGLHARTCARVGIAIEKHWYGCCLLPGSLRMAFLAARSSARDGPDTREQCLRLGAVFYLRKPLQADTLLETVKSAMGTESKQ